jgi:gluconokinase
MTEGACADPERPIVVMGVSGTGKTTVGRILADRLGVDFADADDFHSSANRQKMAGGAPLTDADRLPWLDAIGTWLREHARGGGVVTCSALKRRYRDVLRAHAGEVCFLYLTGSQELISERMASRSGHFMKQSMLSSQLDSLEPPGDDEAHVAVDVAQEPTLVVSEFLSRRSPAQSGGPRNGSER